jgi:hypothetical protein
MQDFAKTGIDFLVEVLVVIKKLEEQSEILLRG